MHTSAAALMPVAPTEARNFHPKAVVDWVAFNVRLERASHGGHLKRMLESAGVSRVIPKNAASGGAATTFRIEIQHPDRYEVIREVIADLEGCYGLMEEPVLTGMEVSCDFWQENDEAHAGPEITRRLMMSITPPVINNPRLANDIESIVLPDRRANIDPDMTLYVGNSGDDLLWRVYWKRTDDTFIGDEGNRHPKPLPESERRARAEVRIQGDALAALGLVKPSDLADFRFECLHAQGYFKFCRKAKGVQVMALNIWARTTAKSLGIDENSPACVLGMFAQRDRRHRLLKLSRYLATDTELTEAVRHALRRLTRRF